MRRLAATMSLAALLALPACGGGTDEATRAAGIVPPDALAFFSVNLDPSVEQKRNLLGIVRRFPDARKEVKGEFDDARDDLIGKLVSEGGLDFGRDVEPWLGDEVALAVLPPAGGDDEPVFVAMVETGDEAKARAALEKATKDEDFTGAYRVVGDFVVFSDHEGRTADETILGRLEAQSRKDDGGLAKSDAFTAVVDELHGDRLVLAWVDVKESLTTARKLGAFADVPFLEKVTERAGPVAVDLHAEKAALVVEGVARATAGAHQGDAALTRALPGDTLGAVTFFDVAGSAKEGLRLLTGSGLDDASAEFERQTGLDLDRDILSWMKGEVVLVAGAVPGGQAFPDFALVVEPSDRARARAALTKVREALARQGLPLEERTVAGATAYAVPQPLVEGVQPAMALFPDRFVLASRPRYLETLAKDASPGFGRQDAYESALGGDAKVTGQFVALLDPIREALEKALLGWSADRARYQRDLKPNLEPLEAFGVVARRDGDLDRVEMKLTFD